MIDPLRIVGDAIEARRLGAEIVIVSLHWGVEGRTAPSDAQRLIAEGLTASGAIDLIVGHHAHVLQPIEQVNGTWVMFGLGNILSNMPAGEDWPAASQDGAVATVEFTVGADGEVAVAAPVVYPTWVDKNAGFVVRLVAADLASSEIDEHDPTPPRGLTRPHPSGRGCVRRPLTDLVKFRRRQDAETSRDGVSRRLVRGGRGRRRGGSS